MPLKIQSTGHMKGSLWGSDNVVSFAVVGVVIDLCWVGVERSIGTFLFCHSVPHSFQILWHSPGELVSISPLHSLIIFLCPNYQKKKNSVNSYKTKKGNTQNQTSFQKITRDRMESSCRTFVIQKGPQGDSAMQRAILFTKRPCWSWQIGLCHAESHPHHKTPMLILVDAGHLPQVSVSFYGIPECLILVLPLGLFSFCWVVLSNFDVMVLFYLIYFSLLSFIVIS